MKCSNDQVSLHAAQSDVFACQRCRSRAYVGESFSVLYPGIREILVADDRGGRGRRSACPKCSAMMQPMRIGRLMAWLDACDSCQLLWVEKLNDNVVRGLKERWKREYALSSDPAIKKEQLAKGLTAGAREHEQQTQGSALLMSDLTNDRSLAEGVIEWLRDAFDEAFDISDLFFDD